DPEFVDSAFVYRRVVADDVNLRERAEGALARDAHFVAALDRPFDFSFHGQTGAKRVLELARVPGPSCQPAREDETARGRHDHCLNPIADGDLERALVV